MTVVRTVLVFGDSNTHGTCPMRNAEDVRRYPPDERFVTHAAKRLPAGTTLIAEGQPGRTTVHDDPVEGAHKNGLRALPVLLETHRPIDVVVLMLGTNDLKARFPVTPEDIARSVERLARTALASGAGPDRGEARLLIVAPPPIEETGWLGGHFRGGAEASRLLAPLLADTAEKVGAGFLDAGAHMGVSAIDGIHFDAAGHAALGRALGDALADLME